MEKDKLEVILMDYKKCKKIEKQREKNKDKLAYLYKKEHFEEKINQCENMKSKIKLYTEQEIIKLKHEILFNKGKYNANMSGISMSILILLTSTFISVYVMLLEIYKALNVGSIWIILIQVIIIVGSLYVVFYVLTDGKTLIEIRYSHNDILLNYQLELVDAELERRKSEKLKSKIQSPDIQSKQNKVQNEKRNRRNYKHRR